MGRKSPNKVEFSRVATVPEIAELRHSGAGDGIFLQSFVLRHFSTVQEGQASEQQLAAQDSWGSNLSWTSECNEARTSWSILSEAFRLHVRFLDPSGHPRKQ